MGHAHTGANSDSRSGSAPVRDNDGRGAAGLVGHSLAALAPAAGGAGGAAQSARGDRNDQRRDRDPDDHGAPQGERAHTVRVVGTYYDAADRAVHCEIDVTDPLLVHALTAGTAGSIGFRDVRITARGEYGGVLFSDCPLCQPSGEVDR